MLELHLDTTDIAKDDTREKIDAMLPQIAQLLAMEAHSHIVKATAQQLHSTRRLYVENLTFYEESPGTWVVRLLKPAQWIEEGRPPGSMVDDFLNGPGVKHAKDGTRYRVIPFHHNRPPTQMTASQNNLRDTIKEVFKAQGIKWGNPSQIAERNRAGGFVDGQPTKFTDLKDTPAPGPIPEGELTPALRRLSTKLLGKLNIMDKPVRYPEGQPWGSNQGGMPMIPGKGRPQGWGPQGQVIQGPTGIPYLQGIKIYENEIKTTSGKLVTQKDVMTFRTVSEKHKKEGRWEHPGMEGKHFFEPAFQHIQNQWESEIKPKLQELV